MSKDSHPYFIPNGDSRRDTAVLLTGTATEFGIDQHDIQTAPGGFNVTEAIARKVYGDDFPEDDAAPATPGGGDVLTGQVPIVTGTPKDGSATTAVPADPEDDDDDDDDDDTEPVDYSTWEYSDLKAEVARRQIDTDDNKAATLAAALTASDTDLADDSSDDDTL